jgi:hypothetical protein
MRSFRSLIGMFLLAAIASGCGPKMLKTKGRVLKDGAPFTVPQQDIFRMALVPLAAGAKDVYPVVFNRDDGTFWVGGKNLKGMPPGKYRVVFDYKADEGNKSPLRKDLDDDDYIYDVNSSTKEIVIDLERPPPVSPGETGGSP